MFPEELNESKGVKRKRPTVRDGRQRRWHPNVCEGGKTVQRERGGERESRGAREEEEEEEEEEERDTSDVIA
ncbi:hypothetical protein NQZ68_036159 [Dissostichus eleginoides]|nr:hypothetical protein NQZ68_036159 [Dissostichus eleginoides]